jgi:hypothetical protein
MTGGHGEHATDEEIIEAAVSRVEGIFTETAGGVTVAAAKKLIEAGRNPRTSPFIHHGNGPKRRTRRQARWILPSNCPGGARPGAGRPEIKTGA